MTRNSHVAESFRTMLNQFSSATPKIITHYVYPPIPWRTEDWLAYHDGDDDKPHRYGWGATEEAALADLMQLDEQQAEEDASK